MRTIETVPYQARVGLLQRGGRADAGGDEHCQDGEGQSRMDVSLEAARFSRRGTKGSDR